MKGLKITILAVLLGSFLGILGWYHYEAYDQWHQVNQMKSRGIPMKAKVLHKETISGKYPTYYLDLSWFTKTIDGNLHRFKDKVQVDDFYMDHYQVGDSIAIAYLEESPEEAVIEGNDAYLEDMVLIILVDLLICIGSIVTLLRYRKERKSMPL